MGIKIEVMERCEWISFNPALQERLGRRDTVPSSSSVASNLSKVPGFAVNFALFSLRSLAKNIFLTYLSPVSVHFVCISRQLSKLLISWGFQTYLYSQRFLNLSLFSHPQVKNNLPYSLQPENFSSPKAHHLGHDKDRPPSLCYPAHHFLANTKHQMHNSKVIK